MSTLPTDISIPLIAAPSSSPAPFIPPPPPPPPRNFTSIYDVDESLLLLGKIPAMMESAALMNEHFVRPTKLQCNVASDLIWKIIRRKKRIIYGGHALNAGKSFQTRVLISTLTNFPTQKALMNTEPESAIYAPDKLADIEFYTPDPLGDVRDICDRLFSMGFSYVQGREAAHLGTFTISIEFKRICDVTYVPVEVFRAIPTITYGGDLLGVHPGFAMIDMLRMLADPFTSHWKLDKTLPRLLLTQRIFPMEIQEATFVKYSKGPSAERCLEWAASRYSVIAVGELACMYYEGKTNKPPAHLSFVSVDYDEDLGSLALAMADVNKLVEEYPLLDMIGRSANVRFPDGGTLTLTDANGRAVPCRGFSYGSKVASFTYTLASSLATRFGLSVRKNERAVRSFDALISRLVTAKKVNNNNIFGEEGLQFMGEPTTAMKRHMAATDERRLKSSSNVAPVWLSYDPKEPGRFNAIKGKYHLLRCGTFKKSLPLLRSRSGAVKKATLVLCDIRFTDLTCSEKSCRCDGAVIRNASDSAVQHKLLLKKTREMIVSQEVPHESIVDTTVEDTTAVEDDTVVEDNTLDDTVVEDTNYA